MDHEQRKADFRRLCREFGVDLGDEHTAQVQRELDALALARRVAQANADELVSDRELKPWVTRYAERRSGPGEIAVIPLYYFHGFRHRFVRQDQVKRIDVEEFCDLSFYSVTDPKFFDRKRYLEYRAQHPPAPKKIGEVQCWRCGTTIVLNAAESCPECLGAKCESGHCLCGSPWETHHPVPTLHIDLLSR